KWPNDVRFQGRKCAGILLETSVGRGQVRSAVLGIGVNINSSPTGPPDLAAAATSLAQEAGHAISRLAVLRDILQELEALYLAVQEGAPVWQEWAGCLETLGSYVHVRWREKVEEGVAEAVDRDGNLVLLRKDGSRVVLTAGEVTLQQHSPFGIAPE
ncbi:MAG: biotin--[acetyl-CoA-carboxylase] ligase, partial [Chloroflexi bacterium]|nr:biotin--[acetyl-CoA-carboxylase] ligase [Chloroflexota bacterium]